MSRIYLFDGGRIEFFCPGCNARHAIVIPGWSWNGDVDRPTFTPSLLSRSGHYLYGGNTPGNCYCDFAERHPEAAKGCTFKCLRCHLYVTDGRIQFLNDCSHALAGQTVDMLECP